MTTKRYFTLCIFDGDKWYPAFGDYELEVVAQELDERLDSDDAIKRSDTRIVCTTDEQDSIDYSVARLNVKRRLFYSKPELQLGDCYYIAEAWIGSIPWDIGIHAELCADREEAQGNAAAWRLDLTPSERRYSNTVVRKYVVTALDEDGHIATAETCD